MNHHPETDPQTQEISALIRQLSETEQRLQALTGGELDAVVDPESGSPIILRRASEQLRRSEARLRLVLEQLPAVVWTTDADLMLTSISGSAAATIDPDSEAWVGKSIDRFIEALGQSEDQAATALSAHRRALAGDSAAYEVTRDGRTFECYVQPLHNNGAIGGCVGLALDITRRVEAQEALQRAHDHLEERVEERTAQLSEACEELQVTEEEIRQQNDILRSTQRELEAERQRYQELFDFAPDGYLITTPGGTIRQANHAASAMLNVESKYLKGKPLTLFTTDEDQGEFFAQLARVTGSEMAGRKSQFELHLAPRDGTPFYANIVAAPIHRDGELTGVRWSVRDVTERVQAQRARDRLLVENRQQRYFLERLMEVAPVGIAVVRGSDRRFEMANPTYRAIPGASSPIIGRPFEKAVPKFIAEGDGTLLNEVQETGQAVSLREQKGAFVPEEGQTYWDVDIVPLPGADGTVDGVLIVAHDVSPEVRARKEMEQLAVETQRQADQLNAVFEAMSDAVVVYDEAGNSAQANQAAVEAYGFDPTGMDRAELIDKLAIHEPEGQPVGVEHLPSSRALRGEDVEGARYIFTNAGGKTLTVVASSAPLCSGEGVTGAVVVWHDVTEREQLLAQVSAERERAARLAEKLRQERDTLRTIMENTHAQLAYLDTDFNFVRVNSAYAEGSGHSPSDLIGQNHFELFPHEENEAIFKQVRDTGDPVSFTARAFEHPNRPEAPVTYWDWSLIPVKDQDGEVQGLVFSLLDVTERERLMARVEAERARLKTIIENAPEGIVLADAQARIVLSNPAADAIYARPVPYEEDFESHAQLQICHPDGTPYEPRQLPLTEAALDGETHSNIEMLIIQPGGERRDVLADAVPIRDGQGAITGAVGLFRGITKRKEMEETIRRYARQLGVLHEIDRAILAAQMADEIAEAALAHLTKLVDHQLATIELFDEETAESTIIAVHSEEPIDVEKGASNPLVWREPIQHFHAGQLFVMEDLDDAPKNPMTERLRVLGLRSCVGVPLIIEGNLIGSLNITLAETGALTSEELKVVQDLGDQLAIGIQQARLRSQIERHAEMLEEQVRVRTAQLQASEARFRAIFEQTAIGIALLDRKGQVLTSNPALQRLLGYTNNELTGHVFTDFAHPDAEIEKDIDVFRELKDGLRTIHRVELRYVGQDRSGWANLILSLVRGPEGTPQFVIAMVEDITERKQAQAAMIQSEKLATTGQLAASLAHEINNPLQAVIGCLGLASEALEEDDGADEEVEEYVEIAYVELQRAARIVSRLRDLSRPTDAERRELTDINALLEQVMSLTHKRLEEEKIEVVERLADDLPKTTLVPDRVQQVFLNLALNAADAMTEGGRLEIETLYEPESAEIAIRFADNGVGIPPEVLSHLFDPFYTTKNDGMGLGLFVSRNIVDQHGGRIEVESEVSQGSVFEVRLPVRTDGRD